MNEPCVLLVDAEELVRTPLAQYLRECGYRVLEAIGAEEAQRLLSGGSQIIDIVLADIQTLGDGGFAFAAWVRENRPEIRVLSAGTIAAVARRAGDLCEEGPHLAKHYEPQHVVEWIKKLRNLKC